MQIDALRQQLLELRGPEEAPRLKWRQVYAAVVPEQYRNQVSRATIWKIAMRPPYEPRDAQIRQVLGLDEESLVLFLDGKHQPKAQAVEAVQCAIDGCENWFVSNHPRRKRCFVCGPYRGQK